MIHNYFEKDKIILHNSLAESRIKDLRIDYDDEEEMAQILKKERYENLIIGRHHHICNINAYNKSIKIYQSEIVEMKEFSS